VSGVRLLVGFVLMGVALPLVLFFLLGLSTPSQFLTIAASTFLTWGVGDLLASILEKPRLRGRAPHQALREELDRRSADQPVATPSRSSS
jgi:hypothetical protein